MRGFHLLGRRFRGRLGGGFRGFGVGKGIGGDWSFGFGSRGRWEVVEDSDWFMPRSLNQSYGTAILTIWQEAPSWRPRRPVLHLVARPYHSMPIRTSLRRVVKVLWHSM